jgi:DegV family protein with EDD domain
LTRIVVDSTCDLPAETMRALDIVSVPLKVHFGDEVFRDKLDMDEAEFFRRLAEVTRLPTTSQPAPGEFIEAYRALPPDETVISIHIAHQLSGTVGSAQLAAKELPDRDIRVIDSGNATWAAGLLVVAAAEAIRAGKGPDEVVAEVEALKPRLRLLAVLDTLKYVIMGGRVSRAQGMIGGLLRVKPIMSVQGGEIGREAPARTWGQAQQKLIEDVRAHGGAERMAVIHAQEPDTAASTTRLLNEAFPGVEVLQGTIGPVIGTYSGPGAVGLAYIAKG